jgi:predicted membrane-bound mannosyltransferase
MDHESSLTPRWIVFGTALVYFALGSVLTIHFMHLKEAWADSHHVFQLEIYHAVPDKVPALEGRFRSACRLQARHGLRSICNRKTPSSLSRDWTQRLCGQRITRQ